jgi:hypothetical protein
LAGQTATFTVTATGTDPLTYQWKKNNSQPIPGANGSGKNIAKSNDKSDKKSNQKSRFPLIGSDVGIDRGH